MNTFKKKKLTFFKAYDWSNLKQLGTFLRKSLLKSNHEKEDQIYELIIIKIHNFKEIDFYRFIKLE